MDLSSHCCDLVKLRESLSPASAIDALKTPIGWSNEVDALFWPKTPDGCFTVKSGYRSIVDLDHSLSNKPATSYTVSKESWEAVWKVNVPEKIKQFVWKLRHNILPTMENLFKKRIANDKKCPICKREVETVEHLFLLCPWTSPLWFGLQTCLVSVSLSTSSLNCWLDEVFDKGKSNEREPTATSILFALWYIWQTRNQVVFEESKPNPMGNLIAINKSVQEFLNAKPVLSNPSTGVASGSSFMINWRPPRGSTININTDAHFNENTGCGYSAIVCRNNLGVVVSGSTSRIYVVSGLVVEALVVREAIVLAESLHLPSILIESDCLNLIEACRENIIRNEIGKIIEDIQSLRGRFTFIGFLWIQRKGNSVANHIVKLAANSSLPANWTSHPPSSLRVLLTMDAK